MIFRLDEEHDGVTTSGEGPFMLFFTGEKVYHLREASPVFQNAEKLFDAAKYAEIRMTGMMNFLETEHGVLPKDIGALQGLREAIEACK